MCSEGSRRFDSQVSLVTGQLMSEVYDAGVLADVQQAQRIVATCLTADSFKGLLNNVSCLSICLCCRVHAPTILSKYRRHQHCLAFSCRQIIASACNSRVSVPVLY